MKQKTEESITRLATNGKSSPVAIFHRDGPVSIKDKQGKWTRRIATVPPSLIMQLDRATRAKLWIRNFRIERAWALAHA